MNFSSELMNICMIVDASRDMVLVQNRTKKNWQGVAFPGGHIDPGEGFGESVVREVYEETGLHVEKLRLVGIVHWEHKHTRRRSIIACYRTEHFSGELKPDCNEGHHEWIPLNELRKQKLAPWLAEQLEVFENDMVSELFYTYDDDNVDSPRPF